MLIRRQYTLYETLRWTRKDILVFALLGTAVVVLYEVVGLKFLAIPWLPLSTIGIAVAFFLGFKNNASYDRQWEARKIYGAIVNSSRSWGMMIIGYVTNQFAEDKMTDEEIKAIHKELIYRHIAWMTALRFQLRQIKSWEHKNKAAKSSRDWLEVHEMHASMEEELSKHVTPEELKYLMSKKNKATQLLNLQSKRLKALRAAGMIDDFRHVEMENMLVDFFTQQGKAERIKNYPFPRQYASMNVIFVWVFILLVPFGLLGVLEDFGEGYIWLTIPFTVLISWIFYTMERIGDYSENPFEGLHNDIPITALSRTIEIDMLEMIDETDIPPPVTDTHEFLM